MDELQTEDISVSNPMIEMSISSGGSNDGNNSSPSPESNTKTAKRRPRRSYNCGPCKRQKIKCDTQIPCGACTRHNRTDQCLAAPPNPPSPDHRKRIKKISLAALSEPVNIKPMRHQQAVPQQSHPNNSHTVSSASPNGTPGANRNQDHFKLPSLQTYTSSFKLSNDPSQRFDAPQESFLPIGQRMQQLPSSAGTNFLSKDPNNIPRPWERSSTSPKYGTGNLFRPMNTEADEIHQLRGQVAILTNRLASLEHKLEFPDRKSMKLSIDDHVFDYLSTVPHQVSLDNPDHGLKSLNIKFIPPDTVANWDSFIQSLPDPFSLQHILDYYKKYLNSPMNIIETKTLESCFNPKRLVRGKNIVTQKDWESLSLTAMVCSLTILRYPAHLLEADLKLKKTAILYASNALFQISKSCLNTIKYRESPKLIHLQVLLLCHQYLKLFNKKNLLITTNSEMVSIAYALDLQSLVIPQNSLEVETSQKIWWMICFNDTLNSLRFQIPPLIRLENLPKPQMGGSHILKAFIPAQVSGYNSIITYIAKITKICNEVPLVSKSSTVEYAESLIVIDRQLTTLQIPDSFSLLNPRNDITTNFQSCYLHFLLILSRFGIYKRIYFSSQNSSIWLIMVSVMENFFKKYNELRKFYLPKDHVSQYLQISEYLIISAIINLLISISDPEILPNGYKQIIHAYFDPVLEDIFFLKGSVLNDSIPFYNQAFKIITKLKSAFEMKESALSNKNSEASAQKQMDISSSLKETKVLESMESELGLVPNNEFFNIYLNSIYQLQQHNSQQLNPTSWELTKILDQDQISFLKSIGIY